MMATTSSTWNGLGTIREKKGYFELLIKAFCHAEINVGEDHTRDDDGLCGLPILADIVEQELILGGATARVEENINTAEEGSQARGGTGENSYSRRKRDGWQRRPMDN